MVVNIIIAIIIISFGMLIGISIGEKQTKKKYIETIKEMNCFYRKQIERLIYLVEEKEKENGKQKDC